MSFSILSPRSDRGRMFFYGASSIRYKKLISPRWGLHIWSKNPMEDIDYTDRAPELKEQELPSSFRTVSRSRSWSCNLVRTCRLFLSALTQSMFAHLRKYFSLGLTLITCFVNAGGLGAGGWPVWGREIRGKGGRCELFWIDLCIYLTRRKVRKWIHIEGAGRGGGKRGWGLVNDVINNPTFLLCIQFASK